MTVDSEGGSIFKRWKGVSFQPVLTRISPVCTGDLSSIMAFDEGLAERMRDLLGPAPGLSERKMFGGLCFLLRGNMSFGVVGSELMVRVGPDAHAEALGLPHAREMDFTGRSMRGMVFVSEDGISEDENLEDWLQRGMAFAGSLPPK
jgi:TfoX N-terminal domain